MNTWNTAIDWLMTAPYNHLTHAQYILGALVLVGMLITLWNITQVRTVVKSLYQDSDTSPSFMRLAAWPCAWLFFICVGLHWAHKPEVLTKAQAASQDEVSVLKQHGVLVEQHQKCVAALWPIVVVQPKPESGFFGTIAQNNLIAFVERACKL